jgi:molecular chaperone DnaK (HSP70)
VVLVESEHYGKYFGIDFGTTNTRIAFFDGEKVIMVPVKDKRGMSYQIPSVVGYKNGKPLRFGYDAIIDSSELVLCKSIKWLMDKDDTVDIGGYLVEPTDIAVDFFRYIKSVIKESGLPLECLENTALTLPVNYSYKARERLCKAFDKAGINIKYIFHEPIAALYCDANFRRMPGVSGVFDWGGGTLDIAAVRLQESWAQVLALDGLKVGGDNFDDLIMEKALFEFAKMYPDLPLTPQQLMEHHQRGPELRLLAENAKKGLSKNTEEFIGRGNLLPGYSLEYRLMRQEFENWIWLDIERALACLKRVIRSSGISEGVLTHLLMSGGTCNIPLVQLRLKQEFGPDRVVTSLRSNRGSVPENDVANATAIGAAILPSFGSRPVFARDIGVRMVDATTNEDVFYTVFQKGNPVEIEKPHTERFFITNPGIGVARLLLCDRLDADLETGGKLKKILTIPVDKNEIWLNVTFTLTRHLSLKVEASGRIAHAKRMESQCNLTDVALGFKIPIIKEGLESKNAV